MSCPDGSVQNWSLFLLPPPAAILLFRISSDQCWEFSKSFRRWSFNLQDSIVPSSSRGNWPWRRRVVSLFATRYARLDWVRGSISVQILSQLGTVLVNEQAEVGLRGFALAFDRLAKASTFVSTRILPTSSQRSPARCRRTLCRSNSWPTYSIREKFWPTSENGLCWQIQF